MTPARDDFPPVPREQLYKEVWAEPITAVAEKYKVSGSFLARICTRLNVPRPPRGYWAMIAAGKKLKRPDLPVARPGDELEWVRYGQGRIAQFPSPKLTDEKTIKRHRRKILYDRHPLLDGAKELITEGRVSRDGFLKPNKRVLVDIITTKVSLDRILDVANELFMALEKRGHSVILEPHGQNTKRYAVDEREKVGKQQKLYDDLWCPARCTLVFIGPVAYGLTIFEMTEHVEVRYLKGKYIRTSELPGDKSKSYDSYTWTSMQDLPSGRLCLQVYSPYPRVSWRRQWRETKAGDFPRKLSGIAKELEAEAATIVRLVEEGKRKAEIEHQQWLAQKLEWEREEAEKRRIKADQDSRQELSQIIAAWAKTKKIERFFADIEQQASKLDADEKGIIMERLKLAREMIGCTDALQWFAEWKTPEERNK